MLGTGKVEFPPLLPAGFHEMPLPALRHLCVDGFPLSTVRAGLMGGIEAICGSLSTALVPASVWIDGSFMTQKIDPADVDLAVRLSFAALPSPGPEQQALFARIAGKQFAGCDSYIDRIPGGSSRARGWRHDAGLLATAIWFQPRRRIQRRGCD
jgi:uncharacterized protein DUF6932